MARQRRAAMGGSSSVSSSNSNDLNIDDDARNFENHKRSKLGRTAEHKIRGGRGWCPTILYTGSATMIILAVVYFLYVGYMETRINTPLNAPKVVTKTGLEVPDRYWGTYRPGVYFGTRTRHPTSLVTGLMWFVPGHFQNNQLALRHWADQGDDISKYGWQSHDGRNFGRQRITDKHIILQTDFVKRLGGKHGGDWTAKIKVLPRKNEGGSGIASLLYYVALDPDDVSGQVSLQGLGQGEAPSLTGTSDSVGEFTMHVQNSSGTILHQHFMHTKHMGLHQLKETVFKGLRIFQGTSESDKYIGLTEAVYDKEDNDRTPNFIVYQITGQVPFEIEVVYESHSFFNKPGILSGDAFNKELGNYEEKFHNNFEDKFSMQEKGFVKDEINFAKAALSNMIGGIAYLYGASRVLGEYNTDPVPYWKAPLYTAVPSRSFFPRGFLWDEGFHNLLISKWDREISQDILAHWFDLMNWDGWIPREQILGTEARARVPDEFVVQRDKNANPPTLLLTLHSMMKGFQQDLTDNDYEYLTHMWPRLRAWYNWFNTTQKGDISGTYRWRGRDPTALRELNPKTLTSGLDDYPRSSHPTSDERHLDLRCWMALASGLMADIANLIEKDPSRFEETYDYLSDNNILDSLHWSYSANGYMDYGLHTNDAELRKIAKPNRQNQNVEMTRVVLGDPKLRFVDSFGYVSFFPLFLQIIDPYSPKLARVIEDLRRPDLLWTQFGLRSLAKNSVFYMKRNTEHDAPYWRGPIWINLNYLAVRALHYYSKTEGPHQELAKEVYKELRNNVITNVMKEYKRTGYIWEQYNDKTGKGQGCRPFTGWSALVVLMMGETF